MKTRKQRTRKNLKKGGNFSMSDFSSNDGFLVQVWGNSLWHVLHTMSFNYPVNPTNENKKNYMFFIKNLKNVLPCGKCRKNLSGNFKKLPLTMNCMINRETFSKYIYNLHEVINTMLGKKSGLSYEEVRNTYENFRARCKKDIKKPVTNNNTKKNESGCVIPFNGEKTKCILTIVPESKQCKSFSIE
jgi:hypothetical protein